MLLFVWNLAFSLASALDNGIRLPPMGWMSWERFGCQRDCATFPQACINADLYKAMADELVDQGFRDVGYTYVSIDDCYQVSRGSDNGLQADPARFPGGMKALGEYIHSKGLKFGVYNDIGSTTCAAEPGLNVSAAPDVEADRQLQKDVDLMAHDWQIDSLKVDGCAAKADSMNVTYAKLGQYLNATGRQILYSCSWPVYQSLSPSCKGSLGTEACFPWKAVSRSCNTWRVFKDIMDIYNLPGHAGVRQVVEVWAKYNNTLAAASHPGAYNDPDMILAGNQGLSFAEAKIQFGMWAMWSAPLLLSNDLRTLDAQTRLMLQNRDVIAINQDPLGASATAAHVADVQVGDGSTVTRWIKSLANGDIAIAFLHTGTFDGEPFRASFGSDVLGLPQGSAFALRDLWKQQDVAENVTSWSCYLTPTSLTMFRVSPHRSPVIV